MLLSLIIFGPLLWALLILFFPSKLSSVLSSVALFLSVIQFFLTCSVLFYFNSETYHFQLTEIYPWIESLGIKYFVGIDGISLWMILLNAFFLPIIIWMSYDSIKLKKKMYYISFFVLQFTIFGVFLSLDLILCYIFWELSLIPMFFIIGIWGGNNKLYASVKFFIYMLLGSLLILLGIIYLMYLNYDHNNFLSSGLIDLYKLNIPFKTGYLFDLQSYLFLVFALGFAIKVPLFPFHTWLPDAHVEAPAAGSVFLAAILLKLGAYGFLRFALPLFPEALIKWQMFFIILSLIGIVYGALMAMVQNDIKKLIAYSSISHMGYVMLGIFVLNIYSINGSFFQMISHAFNTGAFFLLIGVLYQKFHTREISDLKGLAQEMPTFSLIFFIVLLGSIAFPLTNGFVGEFLILLGTFEDFKYHAIVALSGVILSAAYMLWLYKKIFWGNFLIKNKSLQSNKNYDLIWKEKLVFFPIVVVIFWMGIFPNSILDWSKKSLEYLVNNRQDYQPKIFSSNLSLNYHSNYHVINSNILDQNVLNKKVLSKKSSDENLSNK